MAHRHHEGLPPEVEVHAPNQADVELHEVRAQLDDMTEVRDPRPRVVHGEADIDLEHDRAVRRGEPFPQDGGIGVGCVIVGTMLMFLLAEGVPPTHEMASQTVEIILDGLRTRATPPA